MVTLPLPLVVVVVATLSLAMVVYSTGGRELLALPPLPVLLSFLAFLLVFKVLAHPMPFPPSFLELVHVGIAELDGSKEVEGRWLKDGSTEGLALTDGP